MKVEAASLLLSLHVSLLLLLLSRSSLRVYSSLLLLLDLGYFDLLMQSLFSFSLGSFLVHIIHLGLLFFIKEGRWHAQSW